MNTKCKDLVLSIILKFCYQHDVDATGQKARHEQALSPEKGEKSRPKGDPAISPIMTDWRSKLELYQCMDDKEPKWDRRDGRVVMENANLMHSFFPQ